MVHIFSNQKSKFGYILEGQEMKFLAFGVFYDHLIHFMVIWYILPCFGML
jgi:hypothetical protein